MKKKRGQLQISFGMIFSIILIIAFVAVAFYAITKFLCIKNTANIGLFKDGFGKEIERAYNSEETSSIFSVNLPESIEKVCFADYETGKRGKDKALFDELRASKKSNLYFYPLKSCNIPEGFYIKNLDIKEITKEDNPYCIENKGKTEIKIIGYYGNPVKIE